MTNRVLSRYDHKGLVQTVKLAVDCDLMLSHALEHARLRLRRRAVYLVSHDDVCKNGTGKKLEFLRFHVEITDAGHVGRHKVRRELYARKRKGQRRGKGLCKKRLARTRNVGYHGVTAADERSREKFDCFITPYNG